VRFSPSYSRPTSPQSDSEVLCINQDATAQTHLTGDRLILLDDVQWKWGEIPETTPHRTGARRKLSSSKMSQTPLSIADTVTGRLTHTRGAAATVSEEAGSELAAEQPAEQTSEHVALSILEPVDCDSEKAYAESKSLVDAASIQTASMQSASSSNGVDSQVIESLPETSKGRFDILYFTV